MHKNLKPTVLENNLSYALFYLDNQMFGLFYVHLDQLCGPEVKDQINSPVTLRFRIFGFR